MEIQLKSRRRSVAAVCPESLPQARRGIRKGCACACLCARGGGRGTDANYTDRTETTHGFLTVYVFIKSFIV